MPKSIYITPAVRRIALCIVLVVASVLTATPAEAFIRSLWRYSHGTYIDKFVSFGVNVFDVDASLEPMEIAHEAIRRLEVENLPVIVVIDQKGNNLYEKNTIDGC